MKHLLISCVLLIAVSASGQINFEKSYDYYVNSWTNLVFVQDDGYLIPTYGARDKYYLCLLKTDLQGDTLWTKEYYYGELKYVALSGTQDSLGNIYLQSGDYQHKLIKFDKNGNELWVRNYECSNQQNIAVKDNILWMAGEVGNDSYLYKIDALTGDSLNRYLIREFISGSGTSECTSLAVTGNNEVVITLTIRKYGTSNTMYTEFYKLAGYSDKVTQFTVNVPTTTFLVSESRVFGDEIICLGEWIEFYNNVYHLFRYKPDGSLIAYNTYDFDYYYGCLYNFTVNKHNEVIALGFTENGQGVRNILLKAFSPQGDSLWTQQIENSSAWGIDIKATPDNGCIIAGNNKVGNHDQPYLLKTFRRITLPADTSLPVAPLIMNPARERATFDTRELIDGKIILSNQYGRRIVEIPITGDETSWDCNHMEPGLYLYTIIKGKKKVRGKVVVL